MWLGWCGKAPGVSPAHFSARRKPSGIRPKPLQIARAAIVTLPRSCLPTRWLTRANAGFPPALPASAAHGDAQRRSRPDRAGAGCAALRPVPAAGWYRAAYRSDAKTRLRYPESCRPFFIVLQVVPALAVLADIFAVSLGKYAALWYNFINKPVETRGYTCEIQP